MVRILPKKPPFGFPSNGEMRGIIPHMVRRSCPHPRLPSTFMVRCVTSCQRRFMSTPPSDKAPSDKVPSDKAPSDKAPSDKAPSDKAPSDKAPSDKAPSGGAGSAPVAPLLPWWPKRAWRPPPLWAHRERSSMTVGPTVPLLTYMGQISTFDRVELFGERKSGDIQSERFRRIKDSITLTLLRNQDLGQSFYNKITPDTFVVNQQGSVEINPVTPMRMASPTSTILDFIGGADLIQYLQFYRCGQIFTSDDVYHFITCMRSPVIVKGYMLAVHVSLMPFASRPLATIEMHDFIRHDIPPRKKQMILEIMVTDGLFASDLSSNFLLKKWVDKLGILQSGPTVEDEFICLRNLECHQLINKRETCKDLCKDLFKRTGVPATTEDKRRFSYNKHHIRHLVYLKRSMTLQWALSAVVTVDPFDLKGLIPHDHLCIACKFCDRTSGCLRARLLQLMLLQFSPDPKKRFGRDVPPANWTAVTMVKVLRVLSSCCREPEMFTRQREQLDMQSYIQKREQEISLNFPNIGYATARMDYVSDFPETVNLIAGEQVAIFYDDAGWAVVRRTHTNNSFGAVPLQYLEIWSKAQE